VNHEPLATRWWVLILQLLVAIDACVMSVLWLLHRCS
jgi:hypothetical protein